MILYVQVLDTVSVMLARCAAHSGVHVGIKTDGQKLIVGEGF
jgi:hypothetical protein